MDAHARLSRALRHQVPRLLHHPGHAARQRAAYRANQDEPGELVDDESTAVLSCWEYLGSGYLNPGDALLAAGVEASLRAAREALLDRRAPPAVCLPTTG
jgi:hypothetical protein